MKNPCSTRVVIEKRDFEAFGEDFLVKTGAFPCDLSALRDHSQEAIP